MSHTDFVSSVFQTTSLTYCSSPFFHHIVLMLRDWSLITGGGGAEKWEGGHVKFYPYEKGGWKNF